MIDPYNITDYTRTQAELEEFILFCVVVAGKTANVQARLLDNFLNLVSGTPFDSIRKMKSAGTLGSNLREAKLGQYRKIETAFIELVSGNLDLTTCTISDLEKIHGIGPKTSRFFIVHSRVNQQHAIIDTHILKFLRDTLHLDVVTKSTPSSPALYSRLENAFLAHCKAVGKSPADLDLEIWRFYSTNKQKITTPNQVNVLSGSV